MPIYQYGWICPKCERVYAPTVPTCAYCAPPVTTSPATIWWPWPLTVDTAGTSVFKVALPSSAPGCSCTISHSSSCPPVRKK